VQLQLSAPNKLGSAPAGAAIAVPAPSAIAAVNTNFVINNGPYLRVDTRLYLVLLAMPWAEGGDADSDKKPGVIAVQIGLCHHVVPHVTCLPTLIKFIADLMTSGDRRLPGREGDALGSERAQEIAAVYLVIGVRGRGCNCHEAK
jgi:hypothetical protein